MPTKDNLKSARKKFMVMRVKNSIMQLQNTPDEDVDTKLGELLEPLTKTFGEEDAIQILDDAIEAADAQFTGSIQMAIADTVKAGMEKKD